MLVHKWYGAGPKTAHIRKPMMLTNLRPKSWRWKRKTPPYPATKVVSKTFWLGVKRSYKKWWSFKFPKPEWVEQFLCCILPDINCGRTVLDILVHRLQVVQFDGLNDSLHGLWKSMLCCSRWCLLESILSHTSHFIQFSRVCVFLWRSR